MNNQPDTTGKSLWLFFLIAFLIPISATGFVASKFGMQPSLVTSELTVWPMVVVLAMFLAPTIAAMIVAYRDEGLEGIKGLFQQLKSWRFDGKWYLRALLIFPLSILASLWVLSLFAQGFSPTFLVIAILPSALFEELGWTGYALPRLLRRYSPLKVGLLFGVVHTLWHLAADYWGGGNFFGSLYALHFLLWLIGLIVLRVFIVWIYVRTKSLVLGWLTHFSYTGGQILFTVGLSAAETILWNTGFVVVLALLVAYLATMNRDFRDVWKGGPVALDPGG